VLTMFLSIEELSIRLRNPERPTRDLVCRVSLTCDRGETVGLVGESGSGKSLTARAVLRLVPHALVASGSVMVGGSDVLAMSRQELRTLRSRTVAMVFQDPRASINPVRRVGDFLLEGLTTNLGVSAEEAKGRAVALLDAVGLHDGEALLQRYPHELSGGMLQRVMIAGSLTCEPEFLLADEPTTALDVTTQAETVAILQGLQREKSLGLLFITHNLELAAAISGRIYVMYAGHMVETRPAKDLFADPWHPYSAGLLASTPKAREPVRSLNSIPGRLPDIHDLFGGCPFASRCAFREPRCEDEMPPMEALPGGDGAVACYRAQELRGSLRGARRIDARENVDG